MADIKIYKTQDLILKVNPNFNPSKLKIKQWVDFIDVLCGDREYQKEAIQDAIIYLASGEYKTIEDNLMKLIAEKFGFKYPLSEEVTIIDNVLLQMEWDGIVIGNINHKELMIWNPEEAKNMFLYRFNQLKRI